MSDNRVFAETSPSRGAGWVAMRAMLDGAPVVQPWIQALVIEGLGFSINYGAALNGATAPGTFGAGGADLDEFDLLQTLPAAGTTVVIPLLFKPVYEAIGTIAAVDTLLCYGNGGIISNGLTTLTAGIANMRQNSSNASGTTIGGLGDDGGTIITIEGVIYRDGGTHLTGVAATGQTLMPSYSIAQEGFAEIIEGVSKQVAGFASGQASTGYITYKWLEMPSGDLV